MKPRGPGRPPLPKSKRRAAIFSVRLSPSERKQVEIVASARDEKAAAWARRVLLGACARTVGTGGCVG